MRRIALLALIVGASLLALLLVALWYIAGYQSGHGSFGGIMGQMMGSGGVNGMDYCMPSGGWIVLVAVVAIGVLGVVGFGFFLAFPEIMYVAL